MKYSLATAAAAAMAVGLASAKPCPPKGISRIDLGPRAAFLVDDMDEGPLKDELAKCRDSPKPLQKSTFTVAHRGGATLFFPEHTVQNFMAGARMGAGISECDTSFTKDRELVCRHSQCDLQYTTDILLRPELAAKCFQPFAPAADGKPASAKCCTADLTLTEFKSLCGVMEAVPNTKATKPEEFIASGTTPTWRTDLYATCGTVFSLREHIAMTKSLGLLHTPELKTPEIPMPFQGNYTQKMFAQQMVDEYKRAGVPPEDVYMQSFLYDDMLYWLKAEPEFAKQALFLDSYGETIDQLPNATANLTRYVADGLNYIAPPIPYLVTAKDGKIVPSAYADKANELGLKIVAWTLERSGPLSKVKANGQYYYMYFNDAVNNDGDVYNLLDVLYRKIGIKGIFSDWASTVTFYANCVGVGLNGDRP